MIPRTMERMRNQLAHWGYPAFLIDKLKPWVLLNCYNNEKRKRTKDRAAEPIIDIQVIETEISTIKLKKTSKKYRGFISSGYRSSKQD